MEPSLVLGHGRTSNRDLISIITQSSNRPNLATLGDSLNSLLVPLTVELLWSKENNDQH
jgi:hypothetical protein